VPARAAAAARSGVVPKRGRPAHHAYDDGGHGGGAKPGEWIVQSRN
jgi:hypothetical protein